MRESILKINEECKLIKDDNPRKESSAVIKKKTKEIIDSICQIEETIKAKEKSVKSYFASLEFDSNSSSENHEALLNVRISDQDFRVSLGMITEIESNQVIMKKREEDLVDILK